MDMENLAAYVLLALLIVAVLFLVLREVSCWYFKINRRIELLQSINAKLDAQSRPTNTAEKATKEA